LAIPNLSAMGAQSATCDLVALPIRISMARRITALLRPALAVSLAIAGCATEGKLPLPTASALAPGVVSLIRTRPGAPPIPADAKLSPAEVAILAVQNSPDLRAARTRRGVTEAQVIQAGLLPDPVLSGSYNVLLAGPGIANAIGATLIADITALILRPARRRAAEAAARQADADIVWQEWQTASRAQTLAIDLIEQGRALRLIDETLAVLRRRNAITNNALAEGNTTVQAIAPFAVELTALQTEAYIARLALEQNWQALDALLGLQPSVRPALSDRIAIPVISPADAAALIESLPRRRPDLVALQFGYESEEQTLRLAVLAQFPALTLGPNYGNDTTRVQTFGPSMSVALPLFNRNQGQVALGRATRAQLREEYAARLATAEGGARALLANLALLERELEEARSGLGAARRLAAEAETGLNAGLLDELGYVQLVTARLGKERQVIGLEQQVLDQRIALATLLAAGLPPMRVEAQPAGRT